MINDSWRLLEGDCVDVMRTLPAASVDAVICDPPYELGFMSKHWDSTGVAYQKETWEAAFRVLKPGGHLLAFGGTRTYHRLACAVEDAGFEIRDTICWLYGSGFPKSLDVGKAIDKRGGRPDLAAQIGDALRKAREQRGISAGEADRLFCNGSTNWTWFEGRPTGQRPPSPETFARIVEAWPELGELADAVAEAEREIVGKSAHRSGIRNGAADHYTVGGTIAEHVDLTAPATPEAERWDGWGTALKPAWESIVCAQKPAGEWSIIHGNLCVLQAKLQSLLPVKDAAKTSKSKQAEHGDRALLVSAQWTAEERSNTRDVLCEAMDTSQFESALTSSLNIVSSWSDILDALYEEMNTSTTETKSSTTTDLKTLQSSLSDLTPRTIVEAATNHDGLTLSALPAVQAFNAVAAKLNATHTLSAIASATSPERTSHLEAVEPQLEPVVVARKPLGENTVAANVLAHGTGGLNIDGCRIESDTDYHSLRVTQGGKAGGGFDIGSSDGTRSDTFRPASGRWPANVCLDEEAAALLDQQTGELKAGSAGRKNGIPQGGSFAFGDRGPESNMGYGDNGGASRFFLTVKQDKFCVLCGLPCVNIADLSSLQTDALNGSAPAPVPQAQRLNGEGKSVESKLRAQAAESNGKISPETTVDIAQLTAPVELADWIVHLAKSAVHLCDSCVTGTAQSVAQWLRDPIQDSQLGVGSISEQRVQILSQSLALVAVGARSTGTIPTTAMLSGLCGSAVAAITESMTVSDTVNGFDQIRFRYQSKASKRERNAGLEGFEERPSYMVENGSKTAGSANGKRYDRTTTTRNSHPTVKPVALMRWLVRLVTPPGGTVLDPFTGSGSTGIAAVQEGFGFVGIEREPDYVKIAQARISAATPDCQQQLALG